MQQVELACELYALWKLYSIFFSFRVRKNDARSDPDRLECGLVPLKNAELAIVLVDICVFKHEVLDPFEQKLEA